MEIADHQGSALSLDLCRRGLEPDPGPGFDRMSRQNPCCRALWGITARGCPGSLATPAWVSSGQPQPQPWDRPGQSRQEAQPRASSPQRPQWGHPVTWGHGGPPCGILHPAWSPGGPWGQGLSVEEGGRPAPGALWFPAGSPGACRGPLLVAEGCRAGGGPRRAPSKFSFLC